MDVRLVRVESRPYGVFSTFFHSIHRFDEEMMEDIKTLQVVLFSKNSEARNLFEDYENILYKHGKERYRHSPKAESKTIQNSAT